MILLVTKVAKCKQGGILTFIQNTKSQLLYLLPKKATEEKDGSSD
jgi:hypothetical protein